MISRLDEIFKAAAKEVNPDSHYDMGRLEELNEMPVTKWLIYAVTPNQAAEFIGRTSRLNSTYTIDIRVAVMDEMRSSARTRKKIIENSEILAKKFLIYLQQNRGEEYDLSQIRMNPYYLDTAKHMDTGIKITMNLIIADSVEYC